MSEGKDGGGAAVSHLYRFRSIKNLLDRGELENQEIYLAPPEAMNDPTEGIKDVFWRGDRIVWENLFKHCLVCLNVAWALLGVCGEDHPFYWKAVGRRGSSAWFGVQGGNRIQRAAFLPSGCFSL